MVVLGLVLFYMQYLVSFLVLHLSCMMVKRKLVALLKLSSWWCSVAIPRGVACADPERFARSDNACFVCLFFLVLEGKEDPNTIKIGPSFSGGGGGTGPPVTPLDPRMSVALLNLWFSHFLITLRLTCFIFCSFHTVYSL